MKSEEKVVRHIVNWLKNYKENSKMKGFVIGVSGGIDSAVTSTLCAMTGIPVLCLEMEIRQQKKQISDALNHISWLKEKYRNVTHHSISLTSVFENFIEKLPQTDKSEKKLLSLANTRSRLRMTTLYYFSTLNQFLVVGTGNKVEDFGVGFYTKYGDGGVDLSPIADLLKSQVYMIAKYLNIDKSILNALPTDGLWDDGRSDIDQLGINYNQIEWAMNKIESKHDLKKMTNEELNIIEILIPFILSFLTAFLTLKLMVKYIYVFGFTPYVIYRICLGIILLIIAYS